MKHLFWSLLKLNAVGVSLLTFVGFLVGNSGKEPGVMFAFLFFGCIAYLVYLNIRTVYRARSDVVASIRNSAVDVAASAIEFRDSARARVDERIIERQQRRDSNEGQ